MTDSTVGQQQSDFLSSKSPVTNECFVSLSMFIRWLSPSGRPAAEDADPFHRASSERVRLFRSERIHILTASADSVRRIEA
jgi:hypothetical protein